MSQTPKTLRVKPGGAGLQVEFAGQQPDVLGAEFLRVYSPSAEVMGHGLSEPQLVGGKRGVRIEKVQPVGRYAIRLVFSDGHDSGLFTWNTLRDYAAKQVRMWERYLERLDAAAMSRDEADNIMPLSELRPKNALNP